MTTSISKPAKQMGEKVSLQNILNLTAEIDDV